MRLNALALEWNNMGIDKSQHDHDRKRRGIGPFWLGIIAGMLIAGIIFYRTVFEFLIDASDSVLPVVTMPGLLELTVGFIGFGIVLLVNHLRRREQDDEWIVLDDDDDEDAFPKGGS